MFRPSVVTGVRALSKQVTSPALGAVSSLSPSSETRAARLSSGITSPRRDFSLDHKAYNPKDTLSAEAKAAELTALLAISPIDGRYVQV